MIDIFTYHDIFQEVIFRFVPIDELTYSELYSQSQEIQKISLLLKVGGENLFKISRNDIEKLQKYLKAVTQRIEYFEIEKYRAKMKKVFDGYKEASSTLTQFECDRFAAEIHEEDFTEMQRRFFG